MLMEYVKLKMIVPPANVISKPCIKTSSSEYTSFNFPDFIHGISPFRNFSFFLAGVPPNTTLFTTSLISTF